MELLGLQDTAKLGDELNSSAHLNVYACLEFLNLKVAAFNLIFISLLRQSEESRERVKFTPHTIQPCVFTGKTSYLATPLNTPVRQLALVMATSLAVVTLRLRVAITAHPLSSEGGQFYTTSVVCRQPILSDKDYSLP